MNVLEDKWLKVLALVAEALRPVRSYRAAQAYGPQPERFRKSVGRGQELHRLRKARRLEPFGGETDPTRYLHSAARWRLTGTRVRA